MSVLLSKALSMESEAQEVAEENGLEVELELEKTCNEVESLSRELAVEEMQLDELEAAEETLESIAESIRLSIEDGVGLDKYSAEAYALTLESTFGSYVNSNAFSIEGVLTPSQAIARAQTSLESIEYSQERVVQAVANLTAKISQTLASFLSNLFKGVDGLKKRQAELETKVKSLKNVSDDDVVSDQITVTHGNYLHVNKKMDVKSVVDGVQDSMKIYGEVYSDTKGAFNELLGYSDKVVAEMSKLKASDQDDLKTKLGDLSEKSKKDTSVILGKYFKVIGNMANTKLPGGRMVMDKYDIFETHTKEPQEAKYKVTFPLIVNDNTMGGYKVNSKIDTPKVSEIEMLFETTKKFVDQLDKSKKELEDLKKLLGSMKDSREIIARMKGSPWMFLLTSTAGGSTSDVEDRGPELILKLIIASAVYFYKFYIVGPAKQWSKVIGRIVNEYATTQFNTARGLLSYLDASVKAYGK